MRQKLSKLRAIDALEIIKHTEAEGGIFRPKAYLCPAGIWSIGWGHTRDVKESDVCTVQQAEAWLREDTVDAELAVKRRVKSALYQFEFDALVSFVFNIRRDRWNETHCTLLRMVNCGDYAGAARQFQFWRNGEVNGKLEILPGLVKRRRAEAALFCGRPIAEALKYIGERS